MRTDKVVVLVTASSEEEATKIAQVLLETRKAACVNIVPAVQSSFWWQGKLERSRESLLIIKSQASLLDDIVKLVKENHSYTVPEVVALPIIGGNEDYLNWLDGEVREGKG